MDWPTQALAIKARIHWERWLPKKTKELKDAGNFYTATKVVAIYAQAEIIELVALGYQQRDAEKLVLPVYILLAPEPQDDSGSRWSARMERADQRARAAGNGWRTRS